MVNNPERATLLKALALLVLGVYTSDETAAALRIDPSQVTILLASPGMQEEIDAEILRLRFSGRLADLKLAVATERFADRLLSIDASEMCATTAAKVVEIVAKTRQSTPLRVTEEEDRAQQRALNDHFRELMHRVRRGGGEQS